MKTNPISVTPYRYPHRPGITRSAHTKLLYERVDESPKELTSQNASNHQAGELIAWPIYRKILEKKAQIEKIRVLIHRIIIIITVL